MVRPSRIALARDSSLGCRNSTSERAPCRFAGHSRDLAADPCGCSETPNVRTDSMRPRRSPPRYRSKCQKGRTVPECARRGAQSTGTDARTPGTVGRRVGRTRWTSVRTQRSPLRTRTTSVRTGVLRSRSPFGPLSSRFLPHVRRSGLSRHSCGLSANRRVRSPIASEPIRGRSGPAVPRSPRLGP